MTLSSADDFAAKLAALRTTVGAPVVPAAPAPTTAPAPATAPAQRPAATPDNVTDDGAKAELRSLDLLTVYRQWFRPAAERPGGGDEVNCSCFNTGFHARGDQNPQFGINTAKNTYHCHACGVSGDIIDLAANYYGFAGPDLRCPDAAVHEVVKAAGEELCGMSFRRTPAGWQKVPDFVPLPVSATPTSQIPAPAPPPQAPLPPGHVTMVQFAPPGVLDTSSRDLPADLARRLPEPTESGPIEDGEFTARLDWRELIPVHTPLYKYLDVVSRDDSPEEYHFWNFMLLIGLICGKDVGLMDSEIVYGNFLICIVGQTGVGKSRSERHLGRLIQAAAPFDYDAWDSKGVKIVPGSGSGEYMLREFVHTVPDPRNTKTQKFPDLVHPGIRGLVKWSELSEMVGKAANSGATVREKIMEMYDASGDVSFGSITSGKTIVKNPFGSVATTTQPAAIRRLLDKNEIKSGFLNRWLFISGTRKKMHPRGSHIDITPLVPEVRKLYEYADEVVSGQRGVIDLADDAGAEYDRFLVEVIQHMKMTDDLYARLDLTFKKITLLLAANSRETLISLETVERAKAVFEYVVRCYEQFGAALIDTEEHELHEAILDKIRAKLAKTPTEGLAGHEIVKALKRKYTAEQVRAGIRALKELDQIFEAQPPRIGPGRKPTLCYIQEN